MREDKRQTRLYDALSAYARAEAAQTRVLVSLSGLSARAALFAAAAPPRAAPAAAVRLLGPAIAANGASDAVSAPVFAARILCERHGVALRRTAGPSALGTTCDAVISAAMAVGAAAALLESPVGSTDSDASRTIATAARRARRTVAADALFKVRLAARAASAASLAAADCECDGDHATAPGEAARAASPLFLALAVRSALLALACSSSTVAAAAADADLDDTAIQAHHAKFIEADALAGAAAVDDIAAADADDEGLCEVSEQASVCVSSVDEVSADETATKTDGLTVVVEHCASHSIVTFRAAAAASETPYTYADPHHRSSPRSTVAAAVTASDDLSDELTLVRLHRSWRRVHDDARRAGRTIAGISGASRRAGEVVDAGSQET